MRTIAIINQKGGCGKTTTAINLAGVFSRAGLRTLLVDLDPQSHCAAGLAIPENRIDIHIGDAMLTKDEQAIDWTRLLWRVSRNFDLAPSTVRLAGLESTRGGLSEVEHPERRLLSVLSRLADQYDVCLIDCPPAIGLLTYNALVAATEVLIPVETAFFSLQGAAKQVSTIKAVAKRLEVSRPYHLLATMHSPDSTLSRDLLEELQRRFEAKVIPSVIRFDHTLREAVSFGQPVVEYAPHSNGAEDYVGLGRWLLDNDATKPMARGVANDIREQMRTATPEHPALSDADALVVNTSVDTPLTSPVTSNVTVMPGTANTTILAPRPTGTQVLRQELDVHLSRAAELAARAQNLGARNTAPAAPAPVLSLAELTRSTAAAKAAMKAAAAVYGVRQTSQGMLFVQPASLGRSIALAGEFNGWTPHATPLTLNEKMGVFETCLPLPAGQFQYRLVVDGQWITDPHNPDLAPNPFGEANSIITVAPQAQLASI